MILELCRVGCVSSGPQFGVLKINDAFCCLTLERPWLTNIPKVSSIPLGTYTCIKTENRQTSGGMVIPVTYEVMDVTNRSGILFHIGNYMEDTQGCILPGLGIDYEAKYPMLTHSKDGFKRFITMLSDIRKLDLIIKQI